LKILTTGHFVGVEGEFTFYVFQKGFKRVFQAPVSLTPPALNRLPPAVLEDFSFELLDRAKSFADYGQSRRS
jgi:hypothetical protein